MIKTLWFFIRLAVLIGFVGWLATRPGDIRIDVLSYGLVAPLGLVLVAVFLALMILAVVWRVINAILSIPKKTGQSLQLRKQDQSIEAVMIGLSAIAAGDSKALRKAAGKIPHIGKDDHGLSTFMDAMALRLEGKHRAANEGFSTLLHRPETAFLGVRALYQHAIQDGARDQALSLARQAYALHPKQPWVTRILYNEEVKAQHWELADPLLTKLVRLKEISKHDAASERAAMALAPLTSEMRTGSSKEDLTHIRAALKKQPGHLPATLLWIAHLLAQGKGAQAAKAVEKAWKQTPHPELAQFWLQATPKAQQKLQKRRLNWVKKLTETDPDHVQSQLLLAQFFINEAQYDQAEDILNLMGDERSAHRLHAQLCEKRGDGEAQIKHFLAAAADAPMGMRWVCRETGLSYQQWSAFAQPHGAFNTIIWADREKTARSNQAATPQIGAQAQSSSDFLLSA